MDHTTVPPDCFDLQAIQAIADIQGKVLQSVDYYAWIEQDAVEGPLPRCLLAVQLHFTDGAAWMAASGEDSESIQIVKEPQWRLLIEKMFPPDGSATVQRMSVSSSPLWQDVPGQVLQEVLLEKNESGLYYNTALLLVFQSRQILVSLSLEGLRVSPYPEK